MKKLFTATAILATALLAGCGERVEVPPAHVGKIMTKNGYKEGVVGTSNFRLDPCVMYCDKLVLLNTADVAVDEPMTLFMPQDKLNMRFNVRITLTVREGTYDDLYARIPPDNASGVTGTISWQQIYKTYAQQVVRTEAREFLSTYSINEIASSLEAVNAELSKRLSESIAKRTPFNVRYVGISDVQYPELIINAQENAAARREQIQQEEAQLEISKVSLEREFQEQQLQRKIQVEKAEAEAEVNRILASSMTPAYVQYRQLSVMEVLANSGNKVFVPLGMLDSIAGQVAIGNSGK